MIRCPNFRDEKARAAFNAVLSRLGGEAMRAEDVSPRQAYLGRISEEQTRAYHIAHYLWNAYRTPAEINAFLDKLDEVKAALEGERSESEKRTALPEAKPSAFSVPEGYEVDSLTRLPKQQAQQHGGQFRAVGRRLKPWAVKYGYGDTPDEAKLDALRQVGAPIENADKSTENRDVDLKVNTPAVAFARDLLKRLESGKPITAKVMQVMASEIYGGKLSEGTFDRKDMQDALELAVNMHVRDTRHLRVDSPDPRHAIKMLGELLDTLPTQRVRSEEQQSFQQFSTPPNYAAAAAYAANLRAGDVMLEPSAGTGSLIAAASKPGVKIIANELSERRSDLLRALLGNDAQVFHENAEQLNNLLPDSVRPTVVVMNPPFSQTAGRMGDKKDPMVAAHHIEQALKRLEPSGRLVAIVGRGMTMGSPAYRAWWGKIAKDYSVRANIGVDGKVYEKYGTTFGTRLLVIDKVATAGSEQKPILTDVSSADELMSALEPIRDERPAAEHPGAQPRSAELAQGSESSGAGLLPAPAQPGALGPADAERGGRGLAETPRGGAEGAGGQPVRVAAGERAGVAAVEPERPGQVGATGGPAPAAGNSAGRKGGSGARSQRDLQPASQPEHGFAAGGERIELEHAEPGTQGASEISESLYDQYQPQRVRVPGAKPHPSPLVESAAMASVPPPTPAYKPHLPKNVITQGLLSNAQLEPVIYAGEAHSKMLPAAEGETAKRKGFFIGDGTGVGKGREVAGIILDNWNQGRTRAVWVSEKRPLLQDAKRDWSGLGQKPDLIFDLGKIKNGEPINAGKGIAFVTYDTLKGGMSDQAALTRGGFVRKQQVIVNDQPGVVQRVGKMVRGTVDITVKLENGTTVTAPSGEVKSPPGQQANQLVKSRIDQIVEWFGKDYDGVIAFDEAHNMGNGTDTKGERGQKEAAMKAIAGMMLQDKLPNARVVYVSATGATEVSNLAYADRLGLWGRGTPFASRAAFVSEVEQGGIAAMELIARDMKQLGLYTARNLSYDGVEYDRVEHKLDANQREIYNTLARAWQGVLRNINEALKITGGNKDARAKSAAMSAFWGGHQRFFNQIITSMQMPSVIKAVEADLAAGRQAVLQLTNTNEASQERAAAKAQTAEDIEDLDITPRDQIIQLVENSFPTQAYEEYVDDNGKVRARPVVDSKGEPVQDKEAVAMRERLIEQLASVRVPQGPLDMVLDHFGVDTVAEVTGRGRRFVLKPDEKTGQMKRMEESRPGSSNIAETDNFQSGKKKILVFSEAGGTGRSYHADNSAPSKNARRSHYLVQGGWRADKAVQGFGRTHRSNQASAPIFRLVTTDLQGQKRFISSIARRLGQLGALTKGQRQAGDQGVFGARDNLESTEARQALTQFYKDLLNDAIPDISVNDFEEQTGLKLRQKDEEGRVMGNLEDLPPITTFLNRLLSLEIELQNQVFDAFSERLDAVIEARREAGLLDVGMETVKADKITKDSEQTVHTVEGSGAETKYVKLTLADKFKPTNFDTIANNQWRKVLAWVKSPNGKVYAAADAPSLTDATGSIVDNYRLASPVSDSRTIARRNIDRSDSKWEKIDKIEAKELWQKEIASAPEYVTRDLHLITGAILPIWDRLKGNPRVVRLQTDAGDRLIGRVIPNDAIGATLKNLGAKVEGKEISPADLFKKLLAGGRATLANGWSLSRRLVAGEHRIELKGPKAFSEGQDVKKDGLFTERIDYQVRYFVPTEPEQGAAVLKRLTQYRPVVDLTEAGAMPEGMAAGDEPMFALRAGPMLARGAGGIEARGPFTGEFTEHAKEVGPLLRQELDRLGLKDVALNLVDRIEVWMKGERAGTADGIYFEQAITLALDADSKFKFLHHEALHALRSLGLFKETEWNILRMQSQRKWRSDFKIDEGYAGRSEETKNEEGVAHAYAAWANGEMKVDGRIARLFKRIQDFLEALRNAFRGLGFKTAEDVFRDIKSGEVGGRAASERGGGEPALSMRKLPEPANDVAANTNRRIADGENLQELIDDEAMIDNWLGSRARARGTSTETATRRFLAEGGGYAMKSMLASSDPMSVWTAVEAWDERDAPARKLSQESRATLLRQMQHLEGLLSPDGKYASEIESRSPKFKQERLRARTQYDNIRQQFGLDPIGKGFVDPAWGWHFFNDKSAPRAYETMLAVDVAHIMALADKPKSFSLNNRSREDIAAEILKDYGEEPMFAMRTAGAAPTPNLNARIRDRIASVLERAKPAADKFIEGVQDLSHPVKLLQDDLEMRREGAFDDPENFYVRKRLYPGRVGAWTDTFNKKHLDPIVNLLKSNGIGLQEAGDFLYALHAKERNEAMDKINPGLGGEGSGMSNEEADKILAEAKRSEHAAAYDELRQKVAGVRNLILDVMEKAGLEKPEVIAEWNKRYKEYAPLRGWEIEPDDAPPEYRGAGVGFNVRGQEVKQAMGRRSKADNPLVNLFDQAYRTFDRAERNRYLQSLYRALDDLKEDAEDIATLDRGKPKRVIDSRTGLVKTVESSNQYMNPKAVYLKFDGNPHFIVFKDQNLAKAVKRMSPASLGILQPVLNLQNKMKALWTHYSPDFLFRHFMFRYPIEGALNSFEQKEGGPHSVSQYVRESFPLMGTASKAIFASNKGDRPDSPEIRQMQVYWNEMRRAGGAMMFRNMRDIDLTREHLQTALKDLSDSKWQTARAKWRHAIEAMDTVTNALDNSLRLAAFASARRQGKTVQQAALIAREATVDFQQKGLWAHIMGVLFPFANVAVQTAARMSKAVARSKIMRRVFMGTMLAGFLTSAFNYLVAGDDKDGIPFFDKIPEWDRRLNFIVLDPFLTDSKGRPQPHKIPMPYNWAFPLMLGYAFGGMMFGSEGARKLMGSVTKSALETFTAFGSESNWGQMFTPATLRPLGYVYTNEDWAGRPVHREDKFNQQTGPNAYFGRKTTGEGWKMMAEGMNTLTGGSRRKSGVVDLHPEDYREMIDQFIGTQLRLGMNVWDTTASVVKGEWPDPTHVPLGRVVFGTDYDAADRARRYEMQDRAKHPWKR
jgi:predicted RNA methylase